MKRQFQLAKWLVIMDTQWGFCGRAHRWFPINPDNHSGRRLYSLTGSTFREVLVTNACEEATGNASVHGVPNKDWLVFNLQMIPSEQRKLPLLVCGQVAQKIYDGIHKSDEYWHLGPVYEMMHPASRIWTKELLLKVQSELRELNEAS